MSDLISRQDAIDAIDKRIFKLSEDPVFRRKHAHIDLYGAKKLIRGIPSADDGGRLYIKIYADDDPSVMAEKFYQICGETQNGEVAEWLKEYFSSADRPQGEWKPKNHHTDYCSNCGFEETQWRTADYNFCPLCGRRMKGVNNEHTV